MNEKPQNVIHREELYRMVWEKPALKIAEELGVSCAILARTCRKMDVPRPQQGYWAKVAQGQSTRIPPLPAAKDGTKSQWRLRRTAVEGRYRKGEVRAISEILGQDKTSLSDDLAEHKWIRKTRTALKGALASNDDRITPVSTLPHLNLTTSKEHQERALKILNRLVHLAERSGIVLAPKKAEPSPQQYRGQRYRSSNLEVQFHWNGQAIGVRLFEIARQVRVTSGSFFRRWKLIPSGHFEISLTGVYGCEGQKVWKEERKPLEECLEGIVASIQMAAEEQAEFLAKREREMEQRKRMEEMMSALNSQIEREAKAEKEAMADAKRLARAERLRRYAETAEARLLESGPSIEPGSNVALWLEWLRVRADMMDPLAEGKRPWLRFERKVLNPSA